MEVGQPVPMATLFAEREEPKSCLDCEKGFCCCCPVDSCCCLRFPSSDFQASPQGKLKIHAGPLEWCDVVLMAPCCMFLGCCFAVSASAEFDDSRRTVSICNYPGYCFCVGACNRVTLPYSDIGNIGFQNSGVSVGDDAHKEYPYFDVVLVTRQGKVWRVGPRARKTHEFTTFVLNLHRYVFGRSLHGDGGSGYETPSLDSLAVPMTA